MSDGRHTLLGLPTLISDTIVSLACLQTDNHIGNYLVPGCRIGGGREVCSGRLRGWFVSIGTEVQLLRRCGRAFSSAGSTNLARVPPQHLLRPGD
jgi:hypothetical protein